MSTTRALLVALGALLLLGLGAGIWLAAKFGPFLMEPGRVAHSYYIPTESMLPALRVRDHIIPLAKPVDELKRGDVIIFRSGADIRVSRIAGLPGDKIEVDGVGITLNDQRIALRRSGKAFASSMGRGDVLAEQFPGEQHTHHILDLSASGILAPMGTFGPVRVPTGHLFVLGDNRLNAVDSRYDGSLGGVGMVPASAVIGVVDKIFVSPERGKWLIPIDGE